MTLTALVLGTGFAGQGHTAALRANGVEVVGMVGRTLDVLAQVAAELEIPNTGTDWGRALSDLNPDIVAIGTPGGAHVAPILEALAHGCHIFCDKPLATTATDANKLWLAAKDTGVKTAYAASFRYMPDVLLAKELVAQGAIGQPQEVECISHFNLEKMIPFGWSHTLAAGGGRLANNFVHKLSVVQHVLDGAVLAINGTTRSDLDKAPVVSGVHHFRTRRDFIPDSAYDPNLEWRESDSDWSYTVLAQVSAAQAEEPVSCLFKHSGLQPRFHPDYITFYGSDGAITIEGHYGHGPLHLYQDRDKGWEIVEIPDHIMQHQPKLDDPTQRNWNILMRHFVGDIRGEAHERYQTFEDGAFYQQIVDHIHAGDGWHTF